MALISLPPLSGCFESFSYSGQSEVRSGTMTTCCVVNGNMDQSGDPGNQYCMTKHGSSYPPIVYCLRVSGVWNYPMDERIWNDRVHHATRRHRGSWAHVRLPRTKHFQKNFPQNTTQCPWRGEKIRDWPGLKDLALSWRVNRCAVLWCGRDL